MFIKEIIRRLGGNGINHTCFVPLCQKILKALLYDEYCRKQIYLFTRDMNPDMQEKNLKRCTCYYRKKNEKFERIKNDTCEVHNTDHNDE